MVLSHLSGEFWQFRLLKGHSSKAKPICIFICFMKVIYYMKGNHVIFPCILGFIKCCSVHTPSSNPNLPQARQMTLPRTISRRRRQRPGNANPSAPAIAPYEDPLPSYETAIRQGHGRGRHHGHGGHPMNTKQ